MDNETLEQRHERQVRGVAKRNKQDEEKAVLILKDCAYMGGTVLDAFRVLNTADRLGQTIEEAYADWRKTVQTPGFQCPRRMEGGPLSDHGVDHWDSRDNTCSYCGSMNPDEFMHLAEDGATLEPTDKNYKVYVKDVPNPMSGQPELKSIESGPAVDVEGRWTKDDLTDEEKEAGRYNRRVMGPAAATRTAKFYFQHLSAEQRIEFVRLLNEKKLRFDAPGYFYNLPFFCKVLEDGEGDSVPEGLGG